jgi:hypothetical protein
LLRRGTLLRILDGLNLPLDLCRGGLRAGVDLFNDLGNDGLRRRWRGES